MGRIQPEIQLPYPPPPQPQSQPQVHPQPSRQLQPQPPTHSFSYSPQLNYPPQQLYHQPQNVIKIINPSANLQQPGNVATPLQYYQQSSPVVVAHNNGYATISPVQNNNIATALPVQSPPAAAYQQVNGVPWTTGLFECMEDPNNALITAVFPCITFGQIADVLDNGHTTCATSGILYATAPCLVSKPYRKKLRERFGLAELPSSDRIVHSLYEPCGLCQEYRELKNRGIDPALGYHGNLNKNGNEHVTTMVPPPRNQMTS